jgi:hypothetical protein
MTEFSQGNPSLGHKFDMGVPKHKTTVVPFDRDVSLLLRSPYVSDNNVIDTDKESLPSTALFMYPIFCTAGQNVPESLFNTVVINPKTFPSKHKYDFLKHDNVGL